MTKKQPRPSTSDLDREELNRWLFYYGMISVGIQLSKESLELSGLHIRGCKLDEFQ